MPSGTEKSAGSHNYQPRSGSGTEKSANDPGPEIPEFPIHTPRGQGTTGASEKSPEKILSDLLQTLQRKEDDKTRNS